MWCLNYCVAWSVSVFVLLRLCVSVVVLVGVICCVMMSGVFVGGLFVFVCLCVRLCVYVFICERWYGMVLFVLCCVCYSCLCASCVISNALLYGVFCCVLLYSCALFGLTHVVVCLVCHLFV